MKPSARPLFALALCAALAGVTGLTSASAAPKPVCNLVTDAKGDAKGPTAVANDSVLDIISADVGSTAKKLTAVIRVDKLAETTASYPLGITWRVNLTIGDTTYGIAAISDRSGVIGQTSYTDPATGQGNIDGSATAVLDLKANEVRITSPAVGFAGRVNVKAGTEITGINALTGAIFQAPNGVVNLRYATVDTATGGSDYKAGTPTCVPVGR